MDGCCRTLVSQGDGWWEADVTDAVGKIVQHASDVAVHMPEHLLRDVMEKVRSPSH